MLVQIDKQIEQIKEIAKRSKFDVVNAQLKRNVITVEEYKKFLNSLQSNLEQIIKITETK